MRVPWYISVPICLLAVSLTLWLGARNYDFVTPPVRFENVDITDTGPDESEVNAEMLANVTTEDKAPGEEEEEDPPPRPMIVELPASEIDDYLDKKEGGADGYAALAETLVASNFPEHSIVALERLLDSSKPSMDQIKEAYRILKLHKAVQPPEGGGIAISLKLHASVPGDMIAKMTSILNVSAALIEEGSGFKLDVTPEISVVTSRRGKPRPAVTIWLSGKNETPRGHFRTKHAHELGLDEKVNTTIFNIVGPYLEEHTDLTPLSKMHPEINAQETLSYLISRYSWREFGRLLYSNLEQS